MIDLFIRKLCEVVIAKTITDSKTIKKRFEKGGELNFLELLKQTFEYSIGTNNFRRVKISSEDNNY